MLLYVVRIVIGGGIYYTLEHIARGYSHWSMMILGGVCYLSCGIINDISGNSIAMWEKMVLCMVVITVFEFIAGVIINIRLGWNIWDYSEMPFQVMGQICVPYMLLWYVLSYPAIMLNSLCDQLLFW